jgi:hypothetical protein
MPAGHAGTPTHFFCIFDHTCPPQQHCPAVSAVMDFPSGQLAALNKAATVRVTNMPAILR